MTTRLTPCKIGQRLIDSGSMKPSIYDHAGACRRCDRHVRVTHQGAQARAEVSATDWPAHPLQRRHSEPGGYVLYIEGGPRNGEVLAQYAWRWEAQRAARKVNKHPERIA